MQYYMNSKSKEDHICWSMKELKCPVLHIQSNMFRTLVQTDILVFDIRKQHEDLQ